MKPREPRRKVLIRARMRLDGCWRDVRIKDISSRGLLLEAPAAPQRGTYLEVFRGKHVIVARVVWSSDTRFGVLAQDRMNVDAIISEPDLSQHARAVDPATQQLAERRSSSRPTADQIAQRATRNKHRSAAMQFAFTVALGASFAVTLFGIVEETLAKPVKTISEQLALDQQ